LRLFESIAAAAGPARKAALAAVFAALVLLQPIVVVRSLPESAREAIVRLALQESLIHQDDSLRVSYARQFLDLPQDGPRFYYSSRNAIEWLNTHVPKGVRVLSDRNDLLLASVEIIGAFNSMQGKGIATYAYQNWRVAVEDVNRAYRSADIREVERVGRKYLAAFAVVSWPVPSAAYRDGNFSIVRIPAGTSGNI